MDDLRIDRNIRCKVLRNGINLTGSMSEIFVPFFSEFPVFRFMILHTPAFISYKFRKFEKNKIIYQLYSKNKVRENFISKISVRTSKPRLGVISLLLIAK